MEEVLALTVTRDKKGKRDATRAFIPEARKFAEHWEAQGYKTQVVGIDNRDTTCHRRTEVINAIKSTRKLRHLAIFAHGWRTGIQMGFRIGHLRALARQLDKVAADEALIVSLYCCSTAQGGPGGDNGFGDELRDALCGVGIDHCRVDAHTNKGHTTRNPHVRRFEGTGSPFGGTGGSFLVAPRSKSWKLWRSALRTDLRFRFGQMTATEIVEELHGAVHIV